MLQRLHPVTRTCFSWGTIRESGFDPGATAGRVSVS